MYCCAQAKIDEVPCGVVLLAKHLPTSQTYTMREEGKKPLQVAGEISRTHRELNLLSEVCRPQTSITPIASPLLHHPYYITPIASPLLHPHA
jgi:hypothetical protein